MNCGLKSGGHTYSPYRNVHIEIFHFVSRFTTKFMSDVREDFLNMWNVGSRSEEVVSLPSTDSEFSTMNATSLLDSLKFEDPGSFLVTTTLLVLSFLSASFATLDNSTLRLDLSLSLHVESLATGFLYFSNHIDRVLRVSPDGWMHLDSIESQKLLQSSKPGLNVGFDFATILSSPCPCCILFAIVFGQLAELKFSEQQTDLKWLMLHKWRRLSHSSRVKLPFVSMSASWFWCRHFWFESSDPNPNWSCQTTNPEQLCGFWTRRLIVGLLPSMIIWKVTLFDFEIENSSRTVQYKLYALSLRLFGHHWRTWMTRIALFRTVCKTKQLLHCLQRCRSIATNWEDFTIEES